MPKRIHYFRTAFHVSFYNPPGNFFKILRCLISKVLETVLKLGVCHEILADIYALRNVI